MMEDESREFKPAYAAALRLLGRCDRTKKEIKERLSKKGYSADIVEKVLSRLESYDYIDDERYALRFAADAVKVKNSGPGAIRAVLYRKGFERRIIEESVSEVFKDHDEKEVAIRALNRRTRRPDRKNEIKRLSDYLRRKGFSYDIIRQTLRETIKEDEI